jgi:putative FmdB family regulatory protein
MPIYEYGCEKCGGIFEEFQSMTAPPLTRCKLCGSKRVRKLVSSTSFILKGSGWYVTDYSRKSGSSSAGGNGKSRKTGKDDKKASTDSTSSSDKSGSGESGSKESTSSAQT